MFGRLAYTAAPIAYKGIYSTLDTIRRNMRSSCKPRKILDNAKKRLESKFKDYFEKRRKENFLLSNLDWNKVSPVEVGRFLGFDVRGLPEDTNCWE